MSASLTFAARKIQTKEPTKLMQLPSWISNTRKVQHWQIHNFLKSNILELKIHSVFPRIIAGDDYFNLFCTKKIEAEVDTT